MKGLDGAANENLIFIFGDSLDPTEILEKLDSTLHKFPSDIVLIDSFGDIFRGGDSNNNMAMRNTVNGFDRIAKMHKCLIVLFIT